MITLTINNKKVQVEEGTSVLDAATKAGIKIPAMCMADGLEHFNSCMICLVKTETDGKLLPSCSLSAEEGMNIITEDDEIHESRKTALELLLSEHVGDCEAPCTIACTANMNIPKMNRLLEAGLFDEALQTVRKDIALPEVLGWICPAPCENVCKRKDIDEAVSICMLKRYAGKHGKEIPVKTPLAGKKKVALIGGGPGGLSAAFYLRKAGIESVIYDAGEKAGGNLRYAIDDEKLPKDVLDREIQFIEDSGVQFVLNTKTDKTGFQKLRDDYDAVIVATGDMPEELKNWGLEYGKNGLLFGKNSFETNLPGVFAAGNVTRSFRMAVRALGQGKEAAYSALEYLEKGKTKGINRRFNSKVGRLIADDFAEYLKESEDMPRHKPKGGRNEGFSIRETVNEAARCLRCDCREAENCKLRDYSDAYNAKQRRFKANEARPPVRKFMQHESIIYEPEKCIKCGICARLTEKHREKFGFTFIGRGFDVEVAVPFGKEMSEALQKTALLVAENCPTGALAKKDN
jgi:ferredoxin